jgi:hypothetical protein
MSECSGRKSHLIAGLAFLVLALFLALPAAADPPPACDDNDGDGYVQCTGSCDPQGHPCDCADNNARSYPGAPCAVCSGTGCPASFCIPGFNCPSHSGNTGASNGFCLSVSSTIIGSCSNNAAHSCLSNADCPGGTCTPLAPPSGGGLTCNSDGSNVQCSAPLHPITWENEAGSSVCADGKDNDCDGLVDVADVGCQSPEICDGKDNDGNGLIDDGFDVGAACSAGVGACQASGHKVCSADHTTTVCDAVPKAPKVEGPFGSPSCSDLVDNNCDGATDSADAGCKAPAETCNGLDDDGDGVIDNGFDVGTACGAGIGACAATGVKACSADGKSTVCNAVPKVAGVEGPSNPGSCSDGIDNDCDGVIDAADVSCGAIGLRVTCSLPFADNDDEGDGHGGHSRSPVRSQSWDVANGGDHGHDHPPHEPSVGSDCESEHKIVFSAPPGAQVTAQLLALNAQGNIVGALPVRNGDFADIESTIDPHDYELESHFNKKNPALPAHHDAEAPTVLLRIQASDGLRTAVAYCSPEPFLDVLKPTGGVVSVNKTANGSSPNSMPVLVAIPDVSPASLVVKIDGVSLFPALGKLPTACTLSTPCAGDISVGGAAVHVSDLVIDVAPKLWNDASNTLALNLDGLACGGHVVSVSGKKIPGSLPDKVSKECLVDDLADKGTSFTFSVDITSPQNQSTGNPVPTQVTGKVCAGLPIQSVQINGKEIFDPTKLTITPNPPPPPGSDTAARFEFPIDTLVGQTSLARDVVFGDHPVGTFDPGSNFLQAAATDSMGNRVFNNSVVFATGTTNKPGVGAFSAVPATVTKVLNPKLQGALEKDLTDRVNEALRELGPMDATPIEVPNAFVVGLDATALTNFFAKKCSAPGADGRTLQQRFNDLANSKINGKHFGPYSAPFPCSCDPSLTLTVHDVALTSNVACPVLFPGATDPDGAVVPDGSLRVVIQLPDIQASLSGSGSCEDDFLGICIDSASVSADLQVKVTNTRLKFDITEAQLMGTAAPGPPDFHIGTSATVHAEAHSDVGCIGGDICEFLVDVFTFGTVDVTPNIELDRAFSFAEEIGQGEPDPIALKAIKLDEEEIANFNQKVKGSLVDVNISSAGLRASLTGKFATEHVDPDVVANPGAFLEMPPTPELPFSGGQDGAVLVNSDSINMMFASLTLSGRLKSECNPSIDPATSQPRTLGSLLPADCNTLTAPNDSATALGRGFCHGLRAASCETLSAPGGVLFTPIEQGVCHGMEGHDCSMIATGLSGITMPTSCDTITIGGGDSTDPGRATNIAQGRCAGIKALNCETLTASGGTAADTAVKQGACHGAENHTCTSIPTTAGSANQEVGTCAAVEGACSGLNVAQGAQCALSLVQNTVIDDLIRTAERAACNLSPSLNIHASDTLLFCARQDLPPHFVVHDDPATSPVEVGLRMNDLSLGVALDRDGNAALDGPLTSLPPCFGPGSVATGDCSLAALCLDLNFLADFELASSGECPADGGVSKPGFKARITDVQTLNRSVGLVCGGMPAGTDTGVVSGSTANNASIDSLRLSAQQFSPPACMSGLTLGGFVTFQDPTIFALRTGSPKSVCDNDSQTVCTSDGACGGGHCVPIQNFIGISTKIVP